MEEMIIFVEISICNFFSYYHRELSVWTSNMRRAKDTAREVKCANLVEWRSLREIEVRIRFINNTTMRGGIDLYPPVCLSVCLSIHQSIYLSIHLSIYLSICLSIHLSIYLSIHISMSLIRSYS